jgi:transcriptional activator
VAVRRGTRPGPAGGHHRRTAALTAAHPLRETFHRQWLLALHRTHRQAEALAAFHALRRTLVEELGVEPGAAVQAAYREILTDPPPVAAPPATAAPGPPGPVATAPTQIPADVPDFTGRRAELAALLDALRPRPVGQGPPGPRIAVVSGMGGIGKSALAVRAAHLLRPYFPDGQLHADLRGVRGR